MTTSALGQQLREARKRKGLTQEQLAEAMYVSRQTVSNWENDRFQPDYTALERLSDLLSLDGQPIWTQPEEEVNAAEEVAPASVPAEEAPPARSSAKALWLAFAGLLVILCVATMLWQPRQPSADEEGSPAWFQQTQPNAAGKAYIRIYSNESPIQVFQSSSDADLLLRFNVMLKEENGVGCVVSDVIAYFLDDRGVLTAYPLHSDFFGQRLLSGLSTIGAYEYRCVTIGSPTRNEVTGVGMLVKGTDDLGNAFAFRAFFPVARETR